MDLHLLGTNCANSLQLRPPTVEYVSAYYCYLEMRRWVPGGASHLLRRIRTNEEYIDLLGIYEGAQLSSFSVVEINSTLSSRQTKQFRCVPKPSRGGSAGRICGLCTLGAPGKLA